MSENKGVGRKVAVGLGLVCVFLALGLVGAITNYTSIISQRDSTIMTQDQQIQTLTSQRNQLQTSYGNLQTSYTNLQAEKNALQDTYNDLQQKCDILESNYKGLSNNVTGLYSLLYSYSLIPEAFSRTLNDAEVRKTSSAVSSARGYSADYWSSIQKIYNYIVSNIAYAEDIDIPYPSTYWHLDIDGFDYITKFSMSTYRNYVQTPSLTLEIGQGDCDDQAVLAYAMIKYYMKYVYLTDYSLYITGIEFSDGEAHLAIIMPVQGGQLCVIDPAGEYLTSRWGVITSKQALPELEAYSNYWSTHGYVTNMELYSVSVIDGSYSLTAEGTINQIAAIFT